MLWVEIWEFYSMCKKFSPFHLQILNTKTEGMHPKKSTYMLFCRPLHFGAFWVFFYTGYDGNIFEGKYF